MNSSSSGKSDLHARHPAVTHLRSDLLGKGRGEVGGQLHYAGLLLLLAYTLTASAAPSRTTNSSSWPQQYSVQQDDTSDLLTLSTPYYTVQQNLKAGGVISQIRLTYGRATNLLVTPIETRVVSEKGMVFTDAKDLKPRVTHRKQDLAEIITVESKLMDEKGQPSGINVRTVFEYRWGYIKVHKELLAPEGTIRVREVTPFYMTLAPSLSDYGYREGLTEQEGAPPFSFGSCRWGKLRLDQPSDPVIKTRHVPRYMLFADAGVEGLEWFVGSNLSQWDLQLAGRRGQGQCVLQPSNSPRGLALSISPLYTTNAPIALPSSSAFDFYLGLPLLEDHAQRPWFHASFNRNRGNWVSPDQIRRWADSGIQTVHCHNDGDYYDDGLFWRDGSYPPYPDMDNYDQVIQECHKVGIRTATYFSNKELHPSTKEFQEHGSEWGRKNAKGNLQHNFFRGTNQFGAQMCLRSGWLDFMKFSIDRVLKNHPLDGVYYDWNVALYCCNPLHEGKKAGETAVGHWDIDELLDLMEWTRRRVGPAGLVIIHNTTTPMFTTENFSDYIVANEWGYGKWSENGPELAALPLEWSLVGARSRGVISYGQLDAKSPKRLHRLFALEALLGGVAPWPASPEAFELCSMLKPLGKMENYRFADWRNQAVTLEDKRCASCIYSRAEEAYVLLANLQKEPQVVQCVVHPEKFPYPLPTPASASVVGNPGTNKSPDQAASENINVDVRQLTREGVKVSLPGDGAVLLHIH